MTTRLSYSLPLRSDVSKLSWVEKLMKWCQSLHLFKCHFTVKLICKKKFKFSNHEWFRILIGLGILQSNLIWAMLSSLLRSIVNGIRVSVSLQAVLLFTKQVLKPAILAPFQGVKPALYNTDFKLVFLLLWVFLRAIRFVFMIYISVALKNSY